MKNITTPGIQGRKARGSFFSLMQRMMQLQLVSRETGIPTNELRDLDHESQPSRRKFLQQTVSLGALAAGAALLPACSKISVQPELPSSITGKAALDKKYKIVIIGAGIAGLNCAYQLRKKGIYAEIYEASSRTGGRMFTGYNIMAPGLHTEMGGENINSNHFDMLALCKELNIAIEDYEQPRYSDLTDLNINIDGISYTQAECINSLLPFASQMLADIDIIPGPLNYQTIGKAARLDIPMSQYLNSIGMSSNSLAYKTLDLAYIEENGLDSDMNSALQMLWQVGPSKNPKNYLIWGNSDERYHTREGNSKITEALAAKLENQIMLNCSLIAAKSNASNYTITLQTNGTTKEVTADILVLALPFSTLRLADISGLNLPAIKTKCINELSYGTNAKLMIGMKKRTWKQLGFLGECLASYPIILGWDNSLQQPGPHGGYTLFPGGKRGIDIGNGTPQDQLNICLPHLEKLFPGFSNDTNGNVHRMHWPSYPHNLGSYSSYTAGQFKTIAGAQNGPVGNIYFSGEHCSYLHQGFMNGGAESGRRIAQQIITKLG